MAKIKFKVKPETVYNMDDSIAFKHVKIPNLKKSHCDMNAFRTHPKYGGLANSDLFPNVLARIKRDLSKTGYIKLHEIPENVTIDLSGYLAEITIEV